MTRPMYQDAAAAAVLRRTMVLLLLLLMFSLSFPSVTAKCPYKCWCWEDYVTCYSGLLDRIPDRIPPATKVLGMSYNKIRDIESLDHLTELKKLELSHNNISELKNGAFSNLSKLQELFLNDNKIENFETGVFNNLTSLEKLHLFGNKIHKLDLEMFKGLTKLVELSLHYNMISNIPPGIFDSLTSLSILTLGFNNISELKNGAFSYLSKLQTLFLDGNKIENIETGVFNNLTSLKELHLDGNKIHKLDLEMFKAPTKLDILDLSNNEIRDIESLDHLTELKTLNLSINNIRDIEPKSFTHLAELDTLSLSYNNISELKNGAFSNLSKLQNLFLHGNKIENIEIGVFNNLTSLKKLYLSDNKIHKLDLDIFKGPAKLEKLGLGYNKIRDIEPKSLAHLTDLKELELSYNNISELKNGAFSNLSKLQKLLLDGNKIENIDSGVFNNLTSLKELHLNYNKIHKLDLEMFKGPTKLNTLHLNNNMISNIPPGTFDSLTSLIFLRLEHNPLTCDCNILLFVNVWKKNYLNRYFFKNNDDPSCHFPVEMRKKRLRRITENDFNCMSPDIIVVPENKSVSVGEQLQLSCKAIGNPEPSITWAKDKTDLELGQRVQVLQNNTLIISKVERTDSGRYKCVASNSFGRKSFEAMVNVNASPDIIVVPENKTVSVGELLQLSCKAVGNPEPYITWAKDHIDLELGQRVQVLQNNTLIISKVERTDSGRYKCVASNSFGRKSFEAMVNVNASPDIIVVPENKTVSVGELLQLSCKAVGNPEPSITWAKDDIDLVLGQRVQVLQNNTLIISKVERTDGGRYKCVASNSFGRKSFEAMVNVNASPDIIVVPENKTVSVGELLQLSCKAVGNPEPSITWAKDDIDLELGQRVHVLQNNTLIISKVERTDSGRYKCVASNSFGRKSFEATVNVNVLLTTDGKLHLYTDHVEWIIPETEYCVEYYAKNGTAEAAKLRAQVCSNAKPPPISFAYWVIYTASIVCLVLTLIVYATLPYLRNAHGYYVMFYMACQLVYIVCVMIRSTVKHALDSPLCIPFGYFTLFAILTTCCWLNVICFDIYWKLRYNNSTNRNTSKSVRTIMYHIYCWGFSSICVSTGYFFQHSQNETLRKLAPDIGKYTCFLGEYYRYGTFIFYYLPSCGTLAVNLIWFSLTANHYLRIKSQLNTFRQNDSITERFLVYKERFVMSIKLFLVFGIPFLFWILCKPFDIHGILIKIIEKIYYLQGVYIFIIFVAKPKVIKEIRKKFRRSTVQSELTPLKNIPGSS